MGRAIAQLRSGTFNPSSLKLEKLVTTQGNHKGLPLHINIFGTRYKNIVVGAILYGCPE